MEIFTTQCYNGQKNNSQNLNLAAAAAAFDIFQIGFLLLLQHEKNPGFCGLGFFILTVFIPLSFRPFRF